MPSIDNIPVGLRLYTLGCPQTCPISVLGYIRSPVTLKVSTCPSTRFIAISAICDDKSNPFPSPLGV